MPAIPRIEAPLVEVFSSVQGEGVLIGCRQVFVRFAGCNLACDYCDTPFQPQTGYRFEVEPGSGRFSSAANPADLGEITRLIDAWRSRYPNLHHSLAVTGGEPLLHAEALAAWLPSLEGSLPVLLETNGTLPDELARLQPAVTWVSMDVKLASTSGEGTPWDVHGRFMLQAGETLCQVKVVVDQTTAMDELTRVAELMQRHAPAVPLVLQPRTIAAAPAVTGGALLRMQQVAAEIHPETRVIPQVHPLLTVA